MRTAFPDESKRVAETKPVADGADVNEAVLMKTIREIVSGTKSSSQKDRHALTDCDLTIQRMANALDARVALLDKLVTSTVAFGSTVSARSDSPTKVGAKYDVTSGIRTRADLQEALERLEKRLQRYMSAEKSLTNKLHSANLHLKLSRQHIDPNDKEMKAIEQEINNGNKTAQISLFRSLVAKMHRERKELLAMLNDDEKLLDSRLTVFQLRDVKHASPSKERADDSQDDDSQVIRKLKNIREKLNRYIDHEKDVAQHFHTDYSRKRRHLNDEIKVLRQDVETLEDIAQRSEAERGKYKRLYDMERIVKHHSDHQSPRYKAAKQGTLEADQRKPTSGQITTFSAYLEQKEKRRLAVLGADHNIRKSERSHDKSPRRNKHEDKKRSAADSSVCVIC